MAPAEVGAGDLLALRFGVGYRHAVHGTLLGDSAGGGDLLDLDGHDLALALLAGMPLAPDLDDPVPGAGLQVEAHALQPAVLAIGERSHEVEFAAGLGLRLAEKSDQSHCLIS